MQLLTHPNNLNSYMISCLIGFLFLAQNILEMPYLRKQKNKKKDISKVTKIKNEKGNTLKKGLLMRGCRGV